jgi:hypothetical protein
MFRGVYCPFCRRQIAPLGASHEKLQQEGVETMAVVISPAQRARLYFRYHPMRISLAADETASIHRAFGVPRFEVVPDNGNLSAVEWPYQATVSQVESLLVNPDGIFPKPIPPMEAAEILNRKDNFVPHEDDNRMQEQSWTQLVGMYLIDKTGTVQWRHLEAVADPAMLGSFPSEEELLEAARSVNR